MIGNSIERIRGYRPAFAALVLSLVSAAAASSAASAQTMGVNFAADYSLTNLGTAPGVPDNYGGLVFQAGNDNTLLLGGAANTDSGVIDSVSPVRGAGNHITGFTGSASQVATAPGITSGGIDGGLIYAPNGDLLYTAFADSSLGEIKSGSTSPDVQVSLSSSGIPPSGSTIQIIPAGFPNAGALMIATWDLGTGNAGNLYASSLVPDGSGTFTVAAPIASQFVGGAPEGLIYIAGGSLPDFPVDSLLVSENGSGEVIAYELDANGLPIPPTARAFMFGLTGAEGVTQDALTGDFLFSTSRRSDQIFEVHTITKGAVAPEPGTAGLLAGALATLGSAAATAGIRKRLRAAT